MKVAILGATGWVGTRLVDEGLMRGHAVTAIARSAGDMAPRDRLVPVAHDIAGADALADHLGGHDAVIHSARAPRYHADRMGATKAMAGTIIAVTKQAGIRSHLAVGGAKMLFDENGFSHISLEDYAIAMLDEMENPQHAWQKFTVGY
jgi:putative NADH-flavin reductase